MGGHTADSLKVLGKDRVMIHGSFRPNGSSGIVSGSIDGVGFQSTDISRTGVGTYLVTLDKKIPSLVSAVAHVRGADGVGVYAEIGDYDSSAGTFQIRVHQGPKGELPLDLGSAREVISNDIGVAADDTARGSGGLLCTDTTPTYERVNGATDKALRVLWAASNSDEIQFSPIPMLPSMSGANDISVHLLAVMSGSTDTPTIDVQAFDGVGDTEMGGATAALSDTLAEVSATIASTNIAGHPTGFLNVSLVPGDHTTDTITLYAAWLEWLRLVDLAADADNVVSFEIIARNNAGSY